VIELSSTDEVPCAPSLELVLEDSTKFQSEVTELWGGFRTSTSQRGQVVAGFCSVVREHVLGQQHLLALGFDVAAMTLIRPSFESLIRAIWSLEGASEDWIRRFLARPLASADTREETVKGPPVESMLETIQQHHPQWVHQSLVALKDGTWKPMHSYVHGGIRPVLQALVGCPEPQKVAVVLNGNGFVLFATNVLQICCGGPPGAIANIQRRHHRCLPHAQIVEPGTAIRSEL